MQPDELLPLESFVSNGYRSLPSGSRPDAAPPGAQGVEVRDHGAGDAVPALNGSAAEPHHQGQCSAM